ncbi:serine hydrolase-like protein 2 [Calliopsis andreniformis]|uniref:serine hydrolase-like protein 2 n=1 Tax=Calliopsis andreniformis TaxID=337506 RepID=UPI003FCDCF3B
MSQLETEPTEIRIPVPWGHVAAKVYGTMKEAKVLMVHGILDNAGSFDRLLELLPHQYQYVCIDLPGHGFSSPFPPGIPLRFFDYVYTILLVLDALKWKTCIYLAHSFGAHIGTYFSIIYPERIEKIIALDGLLPLPIDNLVSYIKQLYDLKSYNIIPDKLYTKAEVIYALQFKRQEALNTPAAEAMFKRAVTEVNGLYKYNRDPRLRFLVKPIFEPQQLYFLKQFRTPILIILATNCQKKRLVSETVNLLKSNINDKNDFNVVTVIGNHDVHNNYPERVAPHICRFLNNNLQSKL